MWLILWSEPGKCIDQLDVQLRKLTGRVSTLRIARNLKNVLLPITPFRH